VDAAGAATTVTAVVLFVTVAEPDGRYVVVVMSTYETNTSHWLVVTTAPSSTSSDMFVALSVIIRDSSRG
jgi:hypothetical protein